MLCVSWEIETLITQPPTITYIPTNTIVRTRLYSRKKPLFLSKHVQFLLLSIFGFAFWWWQNKLLFLLWPAPARHRLGIRISNTQPNHVHLAVATSNPIHPRTITCTPRLIIFQLNSGNQYLLPWYYFHFISFT